MTTNTPLRRRRNELDGRRGVQVYNYQDNILTVVSPQGTLNANYDRNAVVVDTIDSCISSGGVTTFVSPKYSYYKVTFIIESSTTVVAPYDGTTLYTITSNVGPTYGPEDNFSQVVRSVTIPTLYKNAIAVPASDVSVQIGYALAQFQYIDTGIIPRHFSTVLSETSARAECVILLETGDDLTAGISVDSSTFSVGRWIDVSVSPAPPSYVFVNTLTGTTVYNAHLEISEFTRGL